MSFSGYYQIICNSGHLRSEDCYCCPEFIGDNCWVCDCGEPAAWWNLFDTTNGSYCDCPAGRWYLEFNNNPQPKCCECCDGGIIYGSIALEVDIPEKKEICNLGHEHITEEAKYKIPKIGGHKI